MVENPPWFKISKNCCNYAKKQVAHKFIKENGIDLMIVGIRKAEGGVRSFSYKSCFDANEDGCDFYRPLFWYKDEDEKEYANRFNVSHSDCYEVWGFNRTGCVGCPFNRYLFDDLKVVATYEPLIHKAAHNIFKDSYEYTQQYRDYVQKMKAKDK